MNTAWKGERRGRHVRSALEAVDLAAVAVAAHRDVDGTEAALVGAAVEDVGGQQDHAGAGAEHGMPSSRRSASGSNRPLDVEQHRHRRALTAGQDEGVDPSRSAGADLTRAGAELSESSLVRGEGALQRQDADHGRHLGASGDVTGGTAGHQPRSA
jgi:hypothetical protein